MGKRKQPGKVNGKTSHYWPVEMQLFLVAVACIKLVSDNSEKANIIYCKAKEAWGRHDCQEALNEAKIPFSRMLAAIEAVRTEKTSDFPDPLADVYEQYKDSEDFKYLIDQVNEFIKVGFNSEKAQKKGILKVVPSKGSGLFNAVLIATMVDYSVERPDWDTYKMIEFRGKTYDPTKFMDDEHNNRKYRRRVSSYRNVGWDLRQDDKLRNMAWYWYQSRVVYSGPEEFCRKYLLEEGIELDPANVSNEISLCDMVTGYPRRSPRAE